MVEIIRWAVCLRNFRPSREELIKAVSCIQADEKDRLMKFHFREDFDSSLIGRLLQRKFVTEFGNLPYADIQFLRDAKGKPFINNELESELTFNISHQGDYTVLAGFKSNNKSGIGVDIMKIDYSGGKSVSDFFRLMTKNFSDIEWKNIKKHAAERENLKAFMRHWCLKESYVKNIGIGITIDLQKISFEINDDEHTTCNILKSTKLKVNDIYMFNWVFEEHLIDEDHCVAIALSEVDNFVSKSFHFLSLKELLENCKKVTDFDEEYCEHVFSKTYKKV